MSWLGKIYDSAKSYVGKAKTYVSDSIGKVKNFTDKLRPVKIGDKLTMQLSKYGDISITKIEYSRKPLQKAISTALTVMSLGKVEDVKNKMGYNDITHDGVIVHLQSGEIFRLEKNAVIELNDFIREPGETLYNVPFTKQLTINILLANGKGANQSFYEYDHTKNNCQSFANDIIVKNGLSNPDLESKIKQQDAGQISGTLPNEVNDVMNIATNLGAFGSGLYESMKYGK